MPVFGVILVRIFPYSVRMRENADQNDSEYGHFSRSEKTPGVILSWAGTSNYKIIETTKSLIFALHYRARTNRGYGHGFKVLFNRNFNESLSICPGKKNYKIDITIHIAVKLERML